MSGVHSVSLTVECPLGVWPERPAPKARERKS
jgi:hypothetical protein